MKFFLVAFLFVFSLLSGDPVAVWLTWQKAPESTMIVHWITAKEETAKVEVSDKIFLRKKGALDWLESEGAHANVPEGNPYLIHAIEYNGLEPGTLYEFKVGQQPYFFKTAPKCLDEPVTFVSGGDIYHDKVSVFENMNRVVAERDPLFVVIGGDIAYSCRKLDRRELFDRWLTWLASLSRSLVTKEGRLIPILPVIGNHEVIGKGLQKPSAAKMFYHLFGLQEEDGFRAVHFADYLSLYLLDSNHTHAVKGQQTEWLANELKEKKDVPFKFASYHVPAYPAYRKYRGDTSKAIRQCWSPLFEAHKLTAAFEHHDHVYKRSFNIKADKKDPNGVLYIGDGAWGVDKPRVPKQSWYIAKSAALRHILFITLKPGGSTLEAVGEDGKVFDAITR